MKRLAFTSTAIVVLCTVSSAPAQEQQVQTQAPMQNVRQATQTGDMIRDLNLTPEQREQIRAIREQNKEERAAIGARVAQANRALEDALDADNPDEAAIERLTRQLADAQQAAMRLRIATEMKIRRVLTAEQRLTLRQLRMQASQRRREMQNRAGERRALRQQRLQNRRNTLGPLGPQRQRQRQPF